ncbi:MAG: tRNA (guanosine(37)-N1)-methyltransferase TrmD [Candidatus Sungbacteria bacterium]|nr:tRNA (guanosine(37)-N1)-methyltransferase TrmD [bacterium]MDZ4260470.1 tRNA (guanosine(37)-N1)-methyltransferase TrmD [Candidatus Sungbacteria bacterium]
MSSIRFDVITIFPGMFSGYLDESIIKRAREKKLVDIRVHDLRNFARDKHKKVDDRPYGGGPGMVLKIEPIVRTIGSILKFKKFKNLKTKVVLFSAGGRQFDQKMAREWAKKYGRIVMIAGRYEGVDERIKKIIKDITGIKVEEICIGPYVLTGGELPAMIVVDAVARHIVGVLGKEESLEEKRLGVGIPMYTRPDVFEYKQKKYRVPKELLSGNHAKIETWRRKHSIK